MVIECVGIYKVTGFELTKEYPICQSDELINVGLPPSEEETDGSFKQISKRQ